MSVDPLTGNLPPADIAAIIAGELAALAADAQTLGARLSAGDVVQAVVLPSNGLTDLLEVGGLRVAAELPPTLVPGEVIRVMVTGVADRRIDLRILSTTESGAHEERSAVPPAFVRAALTTVAPVASPQAPATGAAPRPSVSAPGAAAVVATSPAPSVVLKTIEARLAAAYALPPSATRAPLTPLRRADDPATVARNRPPAPPTAEASRPIIGLRPAVPVSAAISPAPRGLAAFGEPVALLRALRLPVTATNVASAKMALESPEKLPNALATLERALANTTDTRIGTLRTLATFVARLDPRSPVLATQIAAFVDHVVTGSEAKFARFSRAAGDGSLPEHAAGPPGPAPTSGKPLALERLAVARAAIDYDLKSQLLGFAARQAGGAKGPGVNAAVAGALGAITGLQLRAAAALDANPDRFAFTLPIALPDGFAAAHVRIDRDTRGANQSPLDEANFHIAFVLETRHLGTVAIDLLTVGRAVRMSVQTEAAPAQRAFGAALGTLTARLEKLRYIIAKADAVVAPPAEGSAPSGTAPVADAARLVDVDA